MSREAVRVRRAGYGWRTRAVIECGYCGEEFIRLQNRRHCSDLCRLLAKISITDSDCWDWQATLDRHGYGTFYLAGRNVPAHRASFLLHGHTIPLGLELDHLCRNRACVNPSHLEPVTRRVNTLRGEAPTASAWREGRCKNGHPRTPENTYVRNERSRQCRICAASSRATREGRAAS